MTDTTLFTPQAQEIEQTIPAIDVTQPDTGMEQPLPDSETPEISPQIVTPVNEASPADPNAPIPAIQPAKPAPEEEELDELIIEDFTIDGICGVY
jgi:mycofactocin precursor